MIIFKDALTDQEWFTDAYKVTTEGTDDFLIAVKAKQITRKKGAGISDSLIGGNPSQEEQQDQAEDDDQESGLDVVLDQGLVDQTQALFCTKKMFLSYVKQWSKRMVDKITADSPEKVECFKECCKKNMKEFMEKWSADASVYTTADYDPGEPGAILIGVWDDDGMGVTMYGVKQAFCEEKC